MSTRTRGNGSKTKIETERERNGKRTDFARGNRYSFSRETSVRHAYRFDFQADKKRNGYEQKIPILTDWERIKKTFLRRCRYCASSAIVFTMRYFSKMITPQEPFATALGCRCGRVRWLVTSRAVNRRRDRIFRFTYDTAVTTAAVITCDNEKPRRVITRPRRPTMTINVLRIGGFDVFVYYGTLNSYLFLPFLLRIIIIPYCYCHHDYNIDYLD